MFSDQLESQVLLQQVAGSEHGTFYEGLSINKAVCSKLDACAALTAEVSTSSRGWIGYTGFGAIYKVTRDFQLFGGMNFGLTTDSFDYNTRFGIVWRR